MIQYDAVEQRINKQVDLTTSALVSGDVITSLIHYSVDSVMICGRKYKTALILSVPSMQKIKTISINTEVAKGKYDLLPYPLLSPHFIPDTGNRFMLECHE